MVNSGWVLVGGWGTHERARGSVPLRGMGCPRAGGSVGTRGVMPLVYAPPPRPAGTRQRAPTGDGVPTLAAMLLCMVWTSTDSHGPTWTETAPAHSSTRRVRARSCATGQTHGGAAAQRGVSWWGGAS
jgi:hypothetical protein